MTMSAGTQCEKFVRNAWKKELCSNCFKAKEEHPQVKQSETLKYHPRLPDPPNGGILKGTKAKTPPKPNKVIFPSNECEVIGYGGDDVFSDDDDLPCFGDESSSSDVDTEEDKALQRLTRANTDYNSVPANLEEAKPGEQKKVVEPLRLGKQVVDDAGKKKTLLVSVTPFGNPSINTTPRPKVKPVEVVKIEEKPKVNIAVEPEEKDGMPKMEAGEAKVLEAPVAIDIVAPIKTGEVGIKRSQPIDKNFKYRPSKDNSEDHRIRDSDIQNEDESRLNLEHKLNEKLSTSEKVANLLDKAKKKVHHLPVIGDNQSFKKTIEFTPVKKTSIDNNKAVVLDMYELKNESEMANELEVKPIPEIKTEVKLTPTIVFETKKLEEIVSSSISEKVLPVVNGLSPKHGSESSNSTPKPVANVSSLHRSPKKQATPAEVLTTSETTEMVPENCSIDMTPEKETLKLENFENIFNGEEVTLFSASKIEETRCSPDGRADPELPVEEPKTMPSIDNVSIEVLPEEPPALPMSPPPTADARSSFLQTLTGGTRKMLGEKPKVPVKPVMFLAKKAFPTFSPRPKSPSMESFLDATTPPPPVPKLSPHHMPLAETLSDSSKKRQAPKPPSPREEVTPLRTARSSENLLEISRSHVLNGSVVLEDVPSPTPRRSMSLSQDNLLNSGVNDIQSKKKSNRGRFSLRKFLHIGKHKDGVSAKEINGDYRQEMNLSSPKPKPEIIHPLDLTGARVEVVPPHRVAKTRRTSSSASSSSGENRESDSSASQSVSSSSNSTTDNDRNRKPPPPPRGLPPEAQKPARPPPPKTINETKQSEQLLPTILQRPRDNFYANIGEVRNGLAPNKPIRTGSLRETDKKLAIAEAGERSIMKKQFWTGSLRHGFSDGGKKVIPVPGPPEDSGYESFDVSLTTTDSQTSSLGEDNMYECVQVVGQRCTSPPEMRRGPPRSISRGTRRSEGSVVDSGQDYIKYRFLRSVSMPYCASEAESDIYSPYSICGSEMGEEEYEWSPTSGRFQKVSRLKMKKGRSIVHKSLEDNYGAVVIANHEALSQVVEQLHQGAVTSPGLRGLSSAPNLRWSDFTVLQDGGGTIVGARVFYPALWGLHPITVCLTAEGGRAPGLYGKTPFRLNPLSELHDLVPASFLPDGRPGDSELVQCSIYILNRMEIDTIHTYTKTVNSAAMTDEIKKEIHFVLLQIINALKSLQAQGIEEATRGLRDLVVVREERDPHPRVCLLPGPTNDCLSLCSCVLDLLPILPSTELMPLLHSTLRQEKAVSLSLAKSILEYTLWGPSDIDFSEGAREPALQRWLDLERATVLHGLVRTRADLSVFEEWHLVFLVRTNAKMMAEASSLLETRV